MFLNKNIYRKKIKGFHLAFNVREKASDINQFKYNPEGTAEELRLHALKQKNARLQNQKQREKDTQIKYLKDKEKARKLHEELRKKKQNQLKYIQDHLSADGLDGGLQVAKKTSDIKKQQEEIQRLGVSGMEKELKRKEEKKKQDKLRKEQDENDKKIKEVESLIVNKQMTFADIEKLNYE